MNIYKYIINFYSVYLIIHFLTLFYALVIVSQLHCQIILTIFIINYFSLVFYFFQKCLNNLGPLFYLQSIKENNHRSFMKYFISYMYLFFKTAMWTYFIDIYSCSFCKILHFLLFIRPFLLINRRIYQLEFIQMYFNFFLIVFWNLLNCIYQIQYIFVILHFN